MNYYIQLKKSNCKNCYKCIRHCPVKSIRFFDQQAHIVKEQCILCGQCFRSCPQNAKQIRNDVDTIKEVIASGKAVYASIAPSFTANYKGIGINALKKSLQQLGFTDAEETALGATIVKQQYENMLRANKEQVMISSCCHTVNSLIQKHYPQALPYLADVISPMLAHGIHLKEQHSDAYTVFIGPCISKKEEAEQYKGAIDCVITFEELTSWLEEEGIQIHKDPADESGFVQGRARLFPVAGGIIRSMFTDEIDTNFISVDGIENCKTALQDIIQGNLKNCFIEMSACAGSCIGGPAMDREDPSPLLDHVRINQYAKEKDFTINSLPSNQMKKNFTYLGSHNQMPGSAAITEILHKMGKTSTEQELNCGSCGYNTCREKAIAVYQGKADLTMCLPFLKERAENFSDNILYHMPTGVLVINENLEVQQINRAAKQILNVKHRSDILNAPLVRILNPSLYLEVMTSGVNVHDKLTYLSDYGRYIEETVIYDRTYHIIISIMRDITVEKTAQLEKEEISKQTIEITNKVIAKQMRVVQEIASLLGETTAETKIALTNLKETLQNE